ncbi:MAG: hypothetical protein ACREVA_04305 [Burkholderiales bacterium]
MAMREKMTIRNAVFIIAVALFAAGVCLSFLDKTGSATVTYTAAVLCLIFVFLSEFKRFKGFGLEAELLEKRIEQANVLISQLRTLLEPISELLFTMVARAGRWSSRLPNRDSYRIMKKFEEELRAVGMTDEQLRNAKKGWHHFNLIDLTRPVIDDIKPVLDEKQNAQQQVIQGFKQPIQPEAQPKHTAEIEKAREISAEIQKLLDVYKAPDMREAHSRIRAFVQECKFFSDAERAVILARNSDSIEDLKYYAKNMEFRRLDVWFGDDE